MAAPITGQLSALFPDVVAWRKVLTRDSFGKPQTFATSVNMPANVVGQHRLVRDAQTGEQRVSTVQAIIGGYYAVSAGDEFTLPSRFDPQQPEAISVEVQSDENGPHHVTVNF